MVKTRMAPSPTGEYHIGTMRTYLYNYAWAKKCLGKLVLRVEDTDKNREVSGATERALSVIKDYGLSWDEGPEVGGPDAPYIQSQRLDIYNQHVETLINNNHAYYCFCTKERLDKMREEQKKQKLPVTRYDKKCLSLSKEQVKQKLQNKEPYVVRLNVPQNTEITWDDIVLGKVTINSNEIDDQVLLKSDGYPTYHLAVVVDDHLMDITIVMRGVEWTPSTPKQILLYKAFGWEMPQFGHLPNLKDADSTKKMSKRKGDVHAISFLQKGYLPEAMLNFLMFLGWNPGTEKEIYSLQEFIQDFDINNLGKTDLVVFDRAKLLWLNGYYIRNMSAQDLFLTLKKWANKFSISLSILNEKDESRVMQIVSLVQERLKYLSEFEDLTHYFFNEPKIDTELLTSYAKDKTNQILEEFIHLYNSVEETNWTSSNLDTLSHDFINKQGYKPKEAFMTLRVAVSNEKATPPLFDMLEVFTKTQIISRLSTAVKQI